MIAVVSLHTPNYQVLADYTWTQNKKEYAERHGYETILKLDNFHGGCSIGYEKIYFLRDCMNSRPDIEWFWWLGTDTLITNFNTKIEEHLDDIHHFIIGEDGNGMNADSFFIKNTPEGRAYINWIIATKDHYDTHVFHEQQAMIESASVDMWKPIIKIVEQHWFNTHDCWPNGWQPGFGYDKLGGRAWWEPGDFVVHWPGSSMETRLGRQVPYYMPKVIR